MPGHNSKMLPISSLNVNLMNPRLHSGAANTVEAIRRIITHVGQEKMANLAIDIAINGLSPKPFYVVTLEGTSDQFTVLDGNRRLTAIKILENPSLLDSNYKKKIEVALSEGSYTDEVFCSIFSSEEDADPWIRREHMGEQGGVGTVPWGTEEKDAYEGKNTLYMQAFAFMKKQGKISEETWAKITKTTLEDRILGSKTMRAFLGLDYSEGKLFATLEPSEIIKGLVKVFNDLANGKESSRSLNTQELQVTYTKKFSKQETPNKSKKSNSPWELSSQEEEKEKPKEKKPAPKPNPYRLDRPRMIPPGWSFDADPLASAIVRELRKIPLQLYNNCAAISVRALLEIATSHYLNMNRMKSSNFKADVDAAIKHMKKQNLSLEDRSYLNDIGSKTGSATKELHAHSHGRLIATEGDLKKYWNNWHRYYELIGELTS